MIFFNETFDASESAENGLSAIFDNVRNFVKNLYFILIQKSFSQTEYITQHVFSSSKNGSVCNRWMLRGASSFFCAGYGVGSVFALTLLLRDRVYR